MTFEQKVLALKENIGYGYESLGEFEGQYLSECAQFGDAGPGQYDTIQRIKTELVKQEAKLAELMATPIGKALAVKWAKEYEERKKAEIDEGDWPF
jgi:hypothetical protein